MRIVVGIVIALAASIGLVGFLRNTPPEDNSKRRQVEAPPTPPAAQRRASIQSVQRALMLKQYDSALRDARKLIARDPNNWEAYMLAAESAAELKQFDDALSLYSQVPESAKYAAHAKWASGEICFLLNKATAAVEHLQASVQINPAMTPAHQRLSLLLNGLGRRFEAYPHMVQVIKSGKFTPFDLMLVGNLKKSIDSPDKIQRFRESVPDDLLPTLGTIVTHNNHSEHAAALQLLEPLLDACPESIEAHAQQGIALSKISPELLPRWNMELPTQCDSHPEIWALRAQTLEANAPKAAVAACSLAIELEPMHLVAHTLAAKLLTRLGDSELAQSFAKRASDLQKINIALEQLYESPKYTKPIREASELALKLGRRWESALWARYAMQIEPTAMWPREIMAIINPAQTLKRTTPFVDPSVIAPLIAEMKRKYPSNVIQAEIAKLLSTPPADDLRSGEVRLAKADASLRLVDVTQSLGIDFLFDSNVKAAGVGRRMFEATGGGVGVLDYDNDGRPDLYFAQGGIFAARAETNQPSDQLFRNLAAKSPGRMSARLENVTQAGRVNETRFSQGVAVGDLDGDGFDDVYVCNVGNNTLLLNQGDGSFIDASQQIQGDTKQWTCSAAIVDLDNDGFPEIYNADYVTGEQAYERVCTIGGRPAACAPLAFTPTQDWIIRATESGEFAKSRSALRDGTATYSLGVLAYRIGEAARPSVFVAVDQQANLLLNPKTAEGPLALIDEAVGAGVAYDASGAAQACMGIAAGDVNHDGEVDLFITNFHLEYDTLYVDQGGYYEDLSTASGTVAATRPMLGFGCLFTDFQLDGNLDLLVLNGHLDDHTHTGVPEKMPAQAFLGLGGGRFEEIKPDAIGEYFKQLRLGRGLAKLDIDADGREDYVCCDLEDPVVILRGESEVVGKTVSISLVGTRSDRNAFCTRVTLRSKGYKRTQQLVAGNGYQVTNERVLRFAIPPEIDKISAEIDWPSGIKQHVNGIRPGERIVVVEAER
ncbi:MAG: FG-GAP-like repeat-containing protein [Aureliella sp.]